MAITLQEPMRQLFYAPYYAALALGAYEQEQLEVKLVTARRPAQAADALFHGTVDACWGGPMRVNAAYDQRANCDLVCFGEAVMRDPFMLVGRVARPNFRLAVLTAVRLATVGEVPTPWLCLQDDVRRVGLDPDLLARVGDQTMIENVYELRHAQVDAIQLSQPLAEQLIASGDGHLWYAAANRGLCSYTSFYGRQAVIDDKRDEMLKLVRGLYRAQKWLHRRTPDGIADVMAPYFPQVPIALLRSAIQRYRVQGIWSETPVLPRTGYDRLKGALVSGGFSKGTPYETAVNNSLAEQVVAEDPPSL